MRWIMNRLLIAVVTVVLTLTSAATSAVDNISSGKVSGITLHSEINSDQITLSYQISGDYYRMFDADMEPPVITRWVALEPSGEVQFSGDDPDGLYLGEPLAVGGVKLVPISFNPADLTDNIVANRSTYEYGLTINSSLPDFTGMSYAQRQMWFDFIINNSDLRRDPARDFPGGSSAAYIYVVPDDRRVSEIMEPLYDLRKKQGYQVKELIVMNEDGRNIREEIQTWHRVGPPVEFVCLVGDAGGEFSVPTLLRGSSDYPYGQLDGNDPYPEAAVGRLSFESLAQLEHLVNKILTYELEMNFDNPDWMLRGSVAAGNRISGMSTKLVSQWVRNLMLDRGFTSVDTFWWDMGGTVANHMRRSFERDVAFVNYRGWTGLENWSAMDAVRLRNEALPVALLLACNTGDFADGDFSFSEALLRADGGAIGALGSSGSQGRVNFNNALLAGFYRGLFDGEPVRLGWMINRAKLELLSVYGQYSEEMAANHCYWTNLMGDPGTIIWTEIPQEATIEAPEELEITDGEIEVRVLSAGDEQPLENIRVGFYKPDNGGPLGDRSVAACTDADGIARITFELREMSGGTGYISISGTQVITQTVEIELSSPSNYIGYADEYFIFDTEIDGQPYVGNGDNTPNPNEVIGLTVSLRNYGRDAIFPNTRYTLTSEADVVTILQGNGSVERPIFALERFQLEFLVRLEPNFPDRESVPFTINAETVDGQQEWSFEIDVDNGFAPRFDVVSVITNDNIMAGANVAFDILLGNNGRMDVGLTSVFIESLTQFAQVIQGEAVYDTLRAGQFHALEDPIFEIIISQFAPPGGELLFRLNCETEDEPPFEGMDEFSIWLPADQPLPITGPDDYGYYALDNQDGMSNIAPIFQWAELNPARAGSGDRVDILDRGEDDDKSVVVDLPFEFTYYGEPHEMITICSNGWAAFGSQDAYVDFRNLPIGSPQGPQAQLCPWWDDLYQPNIDGEMFTFYDEIRHRFIIEWYKMKRYVGPIGPGAEQTFQIILLDPEWYPTYTGDGDIIFQYLNVTAEGRVDGHGTPYATIGIGNSDDSGGLQYGFWNSWADGATPVRSQTSIRFSTAAEHLYGVARGTILDDENNPIRGATVRSSIGGWATSNETGYFRIPTILADQQFRIIANAVGYIESETEDLYDVGLGDSTVAITLNLNRPEMVVDNVDSINVEFDEGAREERTRTIRNQGSGALLWEIKVKPPQNYEPWSSLLDWDVTDETGDNRILGVAHTPVDGVFLVSGGNNGNDNNLLYRFDNEGGLLNPPSINQPCEGLWGFHDLAWDDAENVLYGGCEDLIYKINDDGDLVGSFPSPVIPPRGLTVTGSEADEFKLFVVNEDNPIYMLDEDGNTIGSFRHNLRPYGLAWHPEDSDGYPLYIFSADGETNLTVSKLDISTGDIVTVARLEAQDGDFPGGCDITKFWDTEHWVFAAVIQNRDGDRVQLYDIGRNLDWIEVNPTEGVLDPDREEDVAIVINSADLLQTFYAANIVISHNGLGEAITIPVTMRIPGNDVDDDRYSPSAYALDPVYPNPTNAVCRLNFELPIASSITLSIYDQSGRLVNTLLEGSMSAGRHQHTVSLEDMPSGVYFVRLNSSNTILTQKFVLLK